MNSQLPTVLYCFTGREHLVYAIWSIRSLQKTGYSEIEVIASTSEERQLVLDKVSGIRDCHVIKGDPGDYPMMAYKPFVLEKYIESAAFSKHKHRDLVVCDSDVIWKRNPAALFDRFAGKCWAHKITPVNPNEYKLPLKSVPRSDIGMLTIKFYEKTAKKPIAVWPNFRVNAGLFMLNGSVFREVVHRFMEKIRALAPYKMLMSEELMSLVYAEMGLQPISDLEDVVYKTRIGRKEPKKACSLVDESLRIRLQQEDSRSGLSLCKFLCYEGRKRDEHPGCETAKHFLSNQKDLLWKEAIGLGLDHDNLIELVNMEQKNRKQSGLKRTAKKYAFRALRRIAILTAK